MGFSCLYISSVHTITRQYACRIPRNLPLRSPDEYLARQKVPKKKPKKTQNITREYYSDGRSRSVGCEMGEYIRLYNASTDLPSGL